MIQATYKEMAEYIANRVGQHNAEVWYEQLTPQGELWPLHEAYERVAFVLGDWDRLPTERRDHPEQGEYYFDPTTSTKQVYMKDRWFPGP